MRKVTEREKELYGIRPITDVTKIPNIGHWAVLVQKHESFFVPGDERSRQAPGHGYPEHTESFDTIEYYPFSTPELALEYVEYLIGKEFTPVKSERIRILHAAASGMVKIKTTVGF